MPLMSRRILASAAVLCASIALTARPAAPQDRQAGAASASQQEKLKTCNSLADKKGLKGDERKNFLQSRMSMTTDVQPLSDASPKDKLDACRNLADKKNLKSDDRRSFLKDCMNKLNPK